MSTAEPSDHARRLENLVRQGTLEEVNFGLGRARVKIGEIVTDFLPWHNARAGNRRWYNPPSIGEQVVVLSPGGDLEAGTILLGLSSDANPAPSDRPDLIVSVMADGARFAYDEATGHLSVDGIKSAAIEASGDVYVHAGGSATVKAAVGATLEAAEILLKGAAIKLQGPVTIEGEVTQTGGDMSSNGVVVATHTHTLVKSGQDASGPPA